MLGASRRLSLELCDYCVDALCQYGLIGSTEYGEDFADWLAKYAVAYINVDVSVAGSKWRASGSPSLAHLITKTAKDVEYNGV